VPCLRVHWPLTSIEPFGRIRSPTCGCITPKQMERPIVTFLGVQRVDLSRTRRRGRLLVEAFHASRRQRRLGSHPGVAAHGVERSTGAVGGSCRVPADTNFRARGGYVTAIDRLGRRLPGWPRFVRDQVIWSSPALDDLNRDGSLDVVVGTGNMPMTGGKQVLAFNGNGTVLPGWPSPTLGVVMASPAVGDVIGDGRPEVAVVGADGAWGEARLRRARPGGGCLQLGPRTGYRRFAGLAGGTASSARLPPPGFLRPASPARRVRTIPRPPGRCAPQVTTTLGEIAISGATRWLVHPTCQEMSGGPVPQAAISGRQITVCGRQALCRPPRGGGASPVGRRSVPRWGARGA
jgi:hypothetical protein